MFWEARSHQVSQDISSVAPVVPTGQKDPRDRSDVQDPWRVRLREEKCALIAVTCTHSWSHMHTHIYLYLCIYIYIWAYKYSKTSYHIHTWKAQSFPGKCNWKSPIVVSAVEMRSIIPSWSIHFPPGNHRHVEWPMCKWCCSSTLRFSIIHGFVMTDLPSGNLTQLWKITIYSDFSHENCDFPYIYIYNYIYIIYIVVLVYQRVC